MIRSITLLLYLTGIFTLFGCEGEEKVRVLRLAHGLDMTHPVHKGMEFMATDLEKRSNGQMKITILPQRTIGSGAGMSGAAADRQPGHDQGLGFTLWRTSLLIIRY